MGEILAREFPIDADFVMPFPDKISVDLPRLNTPERPIVNQYCEGKVKSTPNRGVK